MATAIENLKKARVEFLQKEAEKENNEKKFVEDAKKFLDDNVEKIATEVIENAQERIANNGHANMSLPASDSYLEKKYETLNVLRRDYEKIALQGMDSWYFGKQIKIDGYLEPLFSENRPGFRLTEEFCTKISVEINKLGLFCELKDGKLSMTLDEPRVYLDTDKDILYIEEYKAGEFGIYRENGDLVADCFESVEQAQGWYIDRDKSTNQKMDEILKNHVMMEIFSEFPTDLNTNAFDFFLKADVDCTEDVSMSPLGTEWGYEICQEYELDNIRAIRGLMQSMYSSLERLKNALFQCTVTLEAA